MMLPSDVCFAFQPGSNTLMAQSPWVTMPLNAPFSMIMIDRTLLFFINSKASNTESDEVSEIMVADFRSIQFLTVAKATSLKGYQDR